MSSRAACIRLFGRLFQRQSLVEAGLEIDLTFVNQKSVNILLQKKKEELPSS